MFAENILTMPVLFKRQTLVGALLLLGFLANAQTPDDGFFMGKSQICIAVPYAYDSWTEYWEGTLQRDNPNLGRVSRQSVMPMFALGVTDYLNLIIGVPYVSTKASQGVLQGHQGLQDLNIWLKARAFQTDMRNNRLTVYALGGITTPVSNYYPDYLPLSIGLGSTNLTGRGVVQLDFKSGLFFTASGAYTSRGNIELERDFYYDGGIAYYTNEVKMPAVADFRVAAGYVNSHIKANVVYMGMNTLGGNDIRRNDMPFPSNNMDQTRIGAEVQYYLQGDKGLSLLAFGNYTLSGRNTGRSTAFGGGIAYQINNLWK
jgi:hypothetical protein